MFYSSEIFANTEASRRVYFGLSFGAPFCDFGCLTEAITGLLYFVDLRYTLVCVC